jgi:hypothetical protein
MTWREHSIVRARRGMIPRRADSPRRRPAESVAKNRDTTFPRRTSRLRGM